MEKSIKPGPHLFPPRKSGNSDTEGLRGVEQPVETSEPVVSDASETIDNLDNLDASQLERQSNGPIVVDDGVLATIRQANPDRGFAFATLPDGRRVFVHIRGVIRDPILQQNGVPNDDSDEIPVSQVLTEGYGSGYGVQLPPVGDRVVLYQLTSQDDKGGRWRAGACLTEEVHRKMREKMARNIRGVYYDYSLRLVTVPGLSPALARPSSRKTIANYIERHELSTDLNSIDLVPATLEAMCLADEHNLRIVAGEEKLRKDLLRDIENKIDDLRNIFEQIRVFPELVASLDVELDEMGDGTVKILGTELTFKRWGLEVDAHANYDPYREDNRAPYRDPTLIHESVDKLLRAIFSTRQTIIDGGMDVNVLLEYCTKNWQESAKRATENIELQDAILYSYIQSLPVNERSEWEGVLLAHDTLRDAAAMTVESLLANLPEMPATIEIKPIVSEVSEPVRTIDAGEIVVDEYGFPMAAPSEENLDVELMNELLHRLGVDMKVSTDPNDVTFVYGGGSYISPDEMGTREARSYVGTVVDKKENGSDERMLASDVTPDELLRGITRSDRRQGRRNRDVTDGPVGFRLGASEATLRTVISWYEEKKLAVEADKRQARKAFWQRIVDAPGFSLLLSEHQRVYIERAESGSETSGYKHERLLASIEQRRQDEATRRDREERERAQQLAAEQEWLQEEARLRPITKYMDQDRIDLNLARIIQEWTERAAGIYGKATVAQVLGQEMHAPYGRARIISSINEQLTKTPIDYRRMSDLAIHLHGAVAWMNGDYTPVGESVGEGSSDNEAIPREYKSTDNGGENEVNYTTLPLGESLAALQAKFNKR